MAAMLRRGGTWTWLGLVIALLGIPAVVTVARWYGPQSDALIAARELAIIGLCAVLLLIVTKGEGRPLASLGLGFDRPLRSLGQGTILAVVLFASVLAILAVFSILGIKYGEGSKVAPSLSVALLTVVRAGFAEELLYRGFAFTRIEEMTGNKWIAFAVTLIAFALFHFRGGWPGIFLALVLGGLLTLYFMWRRDLLAAIFAHFLVDFVPNIVLPALGAVD